MPDSFFFPTYIGLLSKEHREKIGPALWEFLWFISKTTRDVSEDDETWGIVLGGKPIKQSEIAEEMGVSESTVKRNISRLKQFGYVEAKRAPYGEIYRVRNSKKFKKRKVKSDLSKKKRQTINDLSEPRDRSHMTERQTTYDLSNKDIKDIKEIDIKDDDMRSNPVNEYEKHFGFPPGTFIHDINYWIDESLFKEPEEIICEVIKRAKQQSPRNPAKYISKILNDLHRKELYTLADVKEHNKKFDDQIKLKTGTNKKLNEIDWENL
ncbi:MAG: DnaD domain protein [Bacillaceae bacterium]|nr:DnaD domain protein [Bacillaceae bacterium]